MEVETRYGTKTLVKIPIDDKIKLEGELVIPPNTHRLVIFSHGSGSSRFSPRNNYVAKVLQKQNMGTLLVDLLSREEDMVYETRFNIDLLTDRLVKITKWLIEQPDLENFRIGYFGASTGAASALRAAGKLGSIISTVVSRGGRPDLAIPDIDNIRIPVLLIVGSLDHEVIRLNKLAYERLKGEKELLLVPDASHLFEEPGTLELMTKAAANWYDNKL